MNNELQIDSLRIESRAFYKRVYEVLGLNKRCWETVSTKELGKMLGLSTAIVYNELCRLELVGFVCKFGYYAKDGMIEDAEGSKLKPYSLVWQIYAAK